MYCHLVDWEVQNWVPRDGCVLALFALYWPWKQDCLTFWPGSRSPRATVWDSSSPALLQGRYPRGSCLLSLLWALDQCSYFASPSSDRLVRESHPPSPEQYFWTCRVQPPDPWWRSHSLESWCLLPTFVSSAHRYVSHFPLFAQITPLSIRKTSTCQLIMLQLAFGVIGPQLRALPWRGRPCVVCHRAFRSQIPWPRVSSMRSPPAPASSSASLRYGIVAHFPARGLGSRFGGGPFPCPQRQHQA